MPIRRSGALTIRTHRSRRFFGAGLLGVLGVSAVLLSACSSSSNSASTTTTEASVSLSSLQKWPTTPVALQETGSSLLYPLFNLWVQQIKTEWPNVSVTTAATGSGTGISDASNGTVHIGASDAYLSQGQIAAAPGIENIPLAISGQQVNYNIPGLPAATHLKLNGAVLAAIYQGQITTWNDPKITGLNPGVNIPGVTIVPVHRSDSSGDTFLFSSFLTASSPTTWTLPPGTTVAWPAVTGAVAAQGNGGMVQACGKTPGCVAYIGVSFLNQATSAGLGYAALQNKSGNFELPTQAAIGAEAAGFANSTPASGTLSMIYGSASQGYPIANYEYAIVLAHQSGGSTTAQALKAVLAWAVDPSGGNAPSFLDQVGFVGLPTQVQSISAKLISKIS
jgi:phosphate transport system substrate-binding protein